MRLLNPSRVGTQRIALGEEPTTDSTHIWPESNPGQIGERLRDVHSGACSSIRHGTQAWDINYTNRTDIIFLSLVIIFFLFLHDKSFHNIIFYDSPEYPSRLLNIVFILFKVGRLTPMQQPRIFALQICKKYIFLFLIFNLDLNIKVSLLVR